MKIDALKYYIRRQLDGSVFLMGSSTQLYNSRHKHTKGISDIDGLTQK